MSGVRLAACIAVVGFFVLPVRAFAQEQTQEKPPIEVGGPPLITDDPDTPGKGEWELNLAYTVHRSVDDALSEIPLIDSSYGLIDPIELNLEVPVYVRKRTDDLVQHRMGDPSIGIKWRFLRHGRFAMSFFPQVTFDNSDSRFFQSFGHPIDWFVPVEAQFKVLVFKFDGEIGRDFPKDEPNGWEWGLASRHKISDAFRLLGEVHGRGSSLRYPDELVFNLGTTIQPHAHLPTALFSIGRSLPGARPSKPTLLLYAGAQLTW
jgi:hypothetical protein